MRHGGYFVDFFFVLSGFVISGAYGERLQQGFSLRRYAILRAGRIVPLHVAILMVAVAHEVALGVAGELGFDVRPVFQGEKGIEPLFLTLFLVQSFIVPNPIGWNNPSWSISVEVWLYLAIAIIWRVLGNFGWIAVSIAMLTALITLASGFEGWTTPLSEEIVRGIVGFGLGTLCWHAWRSGVAQLLVRCSALGATLAEISLVVVVCALLSLPAIPGSYAAIDPIFGLLVLLFAAERGKISWILRRGPFLWLGILSYSIYLVHMEVIFYSMHALANFGLVTLLPGEEKFFSISTAWPFGDVIGLGIILASIAASYVTWRFVERPAREWSRRRAHAMGVADAEYVAPTF